MKRIVLASHFASTLVGSNALASQLTLLAFYMSARIQYSPHRQRSIFIYIRASMAITIIMNKMILIIRLISFGWSNRNDLSDCERAN